MIVHRSVFILLIVVFLAGCVTAARFSELRPGMERAEVIRLMGAPDSTGFIHGAEYLYYRLSPSGYEAHMSRGMSRRDYVVRLVHGRVDSYGRAQDIVPARINDTGTRPGHETINSQ